MSANENKKVHKIKGESQHGEKSLYFKSINTYHQYKQNPVAEMVSLPIPDSDTEKPSPPVMGDVPGWDCEYEISKQEQNPEQNSKKSFFLKKAVKNITEDTEELAGQNESYDKYEDCAKSISVANDFVADFVAGITVADKTLESPLVSKKPTRRNAIPTALDAMQVQATKTYPPSAKKWFSTNNGRDATCSPIEIEKLDESIKKIVDDLRSDLLISCSIKKTTHIVAYARNISDLNKNQLLNIYANGNKAIGGSLYDYNSDCFVVSGCDVFEIGTFPFALTVSMKMISSWSIPLPLSEQIILNNMIPISRKRYDDWKNKFPETEYVIEFLQNVS